MGLLRVLLAIAVVIHHSVPAFHYQMTGGPGSVQAFYIISGFYISMILNEKYVGAGSLKVFYFNRFLRLFPVYWLVLALTLIGSWISLSTGTGGGLFEDWSTWWGSVNRWTVFYGALTNLFVFGQDAFMYLNLNQGTGNLDFTWNFWATPYPAWRLLLVPQGWTLAIELSFYLCAPWIVRRGWKGIVAVGLASIGIRVWLYAKGMNSDPWSHRFFPSELVFFCVGALSYRFYSLFRGVKLDRRFVWIVTALVIVATVKFPSIPQMFWYKGLCLGYYALIAIALPFMFMATGRSSLDNAIGELSYPIYISHFYVLKFWTRAGTDTDNAWLAQLVVVTILLSYVLAKFAQPFERLRQAKAEAFKVGRGRKRA